jgi:hypothetical protein
METMKEYQMIDLLVHSKVEKKEPNLGCRLVDRMVSLKELKMAAKSVKQKVA